MRRKHKGESPMHHQIAAVRAELQDYVDRWCEDWPAIDKWASLAIRQGSSDGGRHTNEHADPTATAAVNLTEDPWNQWLDRFRAFRVEARLLEAARERLRPISEQEKARIEEAEQEVCAKCGLPNPSMHRVDGKPYCAKAFDRHGLRGEACYFQEWRDRRRAEMQTG